MNQSFDNKEEECIRRLQRAERIEQMRREKQLQEERRNRLKKAFPWVVGVLGLCLIILTVGGALAKDKKSDYASSKTPKEYATGHGKNEALPSDEATSRDEALPSDEVTSKNEALPSDEATSRDEALPSDKATSKNEALPSDKATSKNEALPSDEATSKNEALPSDKATSKDEANQETLQWRAHNVMAAKMPGIAITIAMLQTKMQEVGLTVHAAEGAPYIFEEASELIAIRSENVISPNAILINENTDTIVASKGARQRICPASMTKVLTVLVAVENIDRNKLDDTFTMTKEITDYAYVNDCSSVGFLEGEKITVRDLFYGTILPSGGDAAVGLATYVAGSHEAFVDMMNEKVKELGLSESAHFTNCVGLYDENLYCSVYDMAVIMKAALQNDFLKEVLSTKKYTTAPSAEHPEGISISNWFLRRIEDKDTGGEVICAKTGYVNESGNCCVSYGTFENEVPYICVTAGATSSWRCIYDHVEIYNQYVNGK